MVMGSITLHRRTRRVFGAVHRAGHGNIGFCSQLSGGIPDLLGRCGAATGGLAEAKLVLLRIGSRQGSPRKPC
jgi:hypothetical protein